MNDEVKTEAAPEAKKPRKPRTPRKVAKSKEPVTRSQAAALFGSSVAVGQMLTLAIAKWLGVH